MNMAICYMVQNAKTEMDLPLVNWLPTKYPRGNPSLSAADRDLIFWPEMCKQNSQKSGPKSDQKCVFKKLVFFAFWGSVLAFVFFWQSDSIDFLGAVIQTLRAFRLAQIRGLEACVLGGLIFFCFSSLEDTSKMPPRGS